MELAHNHTLGTIDNKGTGGRHDGQLTQEHLLLQHQLLAKLLVRTGAHFFIAHETKQGLERCGIGHSALLTFLHRVLRRRK